MAKSYVEIYQEIINALIGRPSGTQIQPEDHQQFALDILEYADQMGNVVTNGFIDEATPLTVPVQPDNANVTYVFEVAPNTTKTFANFRDSGGNPISITTNASQAAIGFLIWNKAYWKAITAYLAVSNPSYEIVSGSIIQFMDGDNPVYPRTRAEAVFFGDDYEDNLSDKISRLQQGPIDNLLNTNLGKLEDIIKSIKVYGRSEYAPRLYVKDIWKDNGDGKYRVFIYSASSPSTELAYFVLSSPEELMSMEINDSYGGIIELCIDWGAMTSQYLDLDSTGTKNIISYSCYHNAIFEHIDEQDKIAKLPIDNLLNTSYGKLEDIIKSIKVYGRSEDAPQAYIRDIWKNNGDNKYRVFIASTSSPSSYIAYFVLDSPEKIMFTNFSDSYGGGIEVCINWDAMTSQYLDLDTTGTKNIINYSCYHNYIADYVKEESESTSKIVKLPIDNLKNSSYGKLEDIIKSIKIYGRSEDAPRLYVRDIWKNNNNDGKYRVFLASASLPSTYLAYFVLDSPEELMSMEINDSYGGIIEVCINWDAMTSQYLDLDTTGTKNIINYSCYHNAIKKYVDDSVKTINNTPLESSLRDAIWAQDFKNPFRWKDYDKAYISFMNDGAYLSLNEYRLACEKYGVPYCNSFYPSRLTEIFTFSDVDGNAVYFGRELIKSQEYIIDISSTTFTKLRLYCDVRSSHIGEDITATLKLYDSGNNYTSQDFVFSNVTAGKTYKNLPSLSGIVKVGIIVSSGATDGLVDKCNFCLTPYDSTANNTVKSGVEIAKLIYINFGEVLEHGDVLVNTFDKQEGEREIFRQLYVNKSILEDAIGVHCINGFVPIGGPNSDRWDNSEIAQRYLLRTFLYAVRWGTTPQYQVQRVSFVSYAQILQFTCPANTLEVSNTYHMDYQDGIISMKVLSINGTSVIGIADVRNRQSTSGNIYDVETSQVITTFSNCEYADNETRAQYFVQEVSPVINQAIIDKEWLCSFCHDEMPAICYEKLIEYVKTLSGIGFTDWNDMYNNFKSSVLEQSM